jgi:DNA-binding transcriptional regulator YiaG
MTGGEVRRLRKRLRLTQVRLAALVGVTANSVARWERGEMAIRESAARLMHMLEERAGDRRQRGKV